MARDFSKSFYNSAAWKKCRRGYIKSTKDKLCERCGEPGEEVHHIIYLNESNIDNPEITLSWNNLELLCQSCHSKEHMTKYDDVREGLGFDSEGNLIEKRE